MRMLHSLRSAAPPGTLAGGSLRAQDGLPLAEVQLSIRRIGLLPRPVGAGVPRKGDGLEGIAAPAAGLIVVRAQVPGEKQLRAAVVVQVREPELALLHAHGIGVGGGLDAVDQ